MPVNPLLSRIPHHSVVIDVDVLGFTAKRLSKAYPKEAGTFLTGYRRENITHPHRDTNSFVVDSYYCPPSDADTWSWTWAEEDFFRAKRWAAGLNREVIGMAHSHPWKHPHFTAVCQSQQDVGLQDRYGLPISLIFNIWQDGWWVTAWKHNQAFPMKIILRTGDVHMTLFHWLRRYGSDLEPWMNAKSYPE